MYICSVKDSTKQNQLNLNVMATKKLNKKFVSMLETMSEFGLTIAYYSQRYEQKYDFTVSYNKENQYFLFKVIGGVFTPDLQALTFVDGITDFKSQNDFFDYIIQRLNVVKY